MDTFYEYEPLYLRDNPIRIGKLTHHNSCGRVHWHEALEILYFVCGSAVTSCNLVEYKVKKGDIVIVNGNELHTGIISQIDSQFYCIQFDPNFFHNYIGKQYLIFQNIIEDDYCTKLLDDLIALNSGKTSAKSIVESKKIAYEFFLALTANYTKQVLGEDDYKKKFKKMNTFHSIISYIDRHYMEDVNVSDLADHFSMSPSYFAHFFKQYAQKSVIEYINEIRIVHAQSFLEVEDVPVGEIALRIGFYDINYFSRKFKSITGKTPTEYRKKYQPQEKSNKQ